MSARQAKESRCDKNICRSVGEGNKAKVTLIFAAHMLIAWRRLNFELRFPVPYFGNYTLQSKSKSLVTSVLQHTCLVELANSCMTWFACFLPHPETAIAHASCWYQCPAAADEAVPSDCARTPRPARKAAVTEARKASRAVAGVSETNE